MKRSIKLAVAAAVALSATSAFATNGDHLIGVGAKARGMGGVGIGMSHGAETALSNPALITSVKGTEVSFGGTIFMPDVQNNMGAGYASSDADLSVIPEVAIAQKASDNFYWGIGMYGTAGMGVDYRTQPYNFEMVTNLQLMQFAVPLAYKAEGFSVAIAPVLQYGSLDMSFAGTLDTSNLGAPYPASVAVGTAEGVSQDFGFGYTIGAAYEMAGLTVGASYKSAIDMEYKNQITGALTDFHNFGILTNINTDHLEQPAEIGVGASYKMGGHTFAVDYKRIQWSDAKGYKDFKWDDQNVYIFGYQYAQDNWALRLGYNHATSPIKEQNGATGDGAALNMFNLAGFPATVEDHYTIGGSYAFNKMTSIDVAYVYADEVTDTYSMSYFGNLGATNPQSISTKHSQDAVSMQLNFNF